MTRPGQDSVAPARPSAMYARVRLMLAQMAVILMVTLGLFFLPEPVGYALLFLTYAALARAERRLEIRNPQTLAVLGLAAAALLGLPWQDHYGLYVPMVFFGLLAALSAVSMARGVPPTSVYGRGEGRAVLHWATSGLWLALHLAGLVVSIAMFRNPGLIYLLPALLVGGVLCTLWLQLVSRIGAEPALVEVVSGPLTFRELEPTPDAVEQFYAHYVRQSLPQTRGARGRADPGRGATRDVPDVAALARAEIAAEGAAVQAQRYFVALEGKALVGSISVLVLRPGLDLSEIDAPLRLEALRAIAPVVRCDNLCIDPRYRNRPEVFQRLLRASVEAAFEADAGFMVTLAYGTAAPIYAKIGFEPMLAAPRPSRRSGAALMPMVYNLSRAAICDLDEVRRYGFGRDGSTGARGLGERYFKRQVVRDLWRRPPAWSVETRHWAEDAVPPADAAGLAPFAPAPAAAALAKAAP